MKNVINNGQVPNIRFFDKAALAAAGIEVIQAEDHVYFDKINFERTLNAYRTSVEYLNIAIKEYEDVFGRPITNEDFRHLINKDKNMLRSSYEVLIQERLSKVTSPTLRKLDEEAYNKDGRHFFYKVDNFVWGYAEKKFNIHKITLKEGRAVFNDTDEASLRKEFSIDFTSLEFIQLFDKCRALQGAYKEVYDHLKSNVSTIGIDPEHEMIISDSGMIYLDFLDGYRMKFNLDNLTLRI